MIYKKIVVTGGHHNSALLVAELLLEKKYQVVWFGHKYSMIGDKSPSAEYLEVTAKNIPFVDIKAGKWQPKFKFVQYMARIPLGFSQSFCSLIREKPSLVISFGGYLALPTAVCAWILGILVVTHEQTSVSGLANTIISKLARKVFVSFPSSLGLFPQNKVVLTGLPVRPSIFRAGRKLFNNQKQTIYITGGKQGAHVLNQFVFEILEKLLENFNLIHQCGSTTIFNDIETAKKLKEKSPKKNDYLVKEYFFEDEIGSVFASADFVVSRAGAHMVYELLSLRKPAILVPIPWSNKNEQEENAKIMVRLGLAEILPQCDLQKGLLYETITRFNTNLKNYGLKSKDNFLVGNAADRIVEEIEKVLYNGLV